MKRKLRVTTIRGHTFCAGLINADSVVIDLGANLGEFSYEISNHCRCKSYAVEASPLLYSQIKESALLKKHNCAITDANGLVTLNLSKNPEGNRIGYLSDDLKQEVVIVNGVTFESFMAAEHITIIDLLKIDIEGAEINLFRSTSDDIIRKINQITIEFHDFIPELNCANEVENVKNRLRELGFFCVVFSKSYNTDVLFIKNSVVSNLEYQYLKYLVKYKRGGLRFLRRILGPRNTKAQEFV